MWLRKRKKKKEENSIELQKPNIEAEVYDNNKKNVTEEKENKVQNLNWIS